MKNLFRPLCHDFFSSAVERGLYVYVESGKLKVANPSGDVFSIKHGWCSRNGEISKLAKNKTAVRSLLRSNGYPVPRGEVFSPEEQGSALLYARAIGFPVVVKPNDMAHGKGVYTNIADDDDFVYFFGKCSSYGGNVIVEKHFEGEEYRFLLVGSKVSAVMMRRPANVVGDGCSDIESLINRKNELKRESGHPIHVIDDVLAEEMERRCITLDSVPREGELVVLRGVSNISAGGDRVDVTDEVNKGYIDAVEEISAMLFPDIVFSGFDVFIKDFRSNPEDGGWAICEINNMPNLNHYSVIEGKPRGVADLALDMFYPETSKNKCKVYFHGEHLYQGGVYLRAVGEFRDFAFPREVAREARERNVTGWVRKVSGKGYECVLKGDVGSVSKVVEWIRIVGRDCPEYVKLVSLPVSVSDSFLVRRESAKFYRRLPVKLIESFGSVVEVFSSGFCRRQSLVVTFQKNDKKIFLSSIGEGLKKSILSEWVESGKCHVRLGFSSSSKSVFVQHVFDSLCKSGLVFRVSIDKL